MGSVDGVLRLHQQQPRLELLQSQQRATGSYSVPCQLIHRGGGASVMSTFLTSRSYSSRVMASRHRDLHRHQSKQKKTSSSLPCLVLPPDFARNQIEDDHREEDYYYCYYSLGEKRVIGVKDGSGNKRRLLPWEKELLLPADAYCVASSHGWLAYLIHNDDCSIHLFKHPPLSSHDFFTSEMLRLPPLQTHPRISRVVTRKAPADPNRPHPVTRDYFYWNSDNSSEDEEEHHPKPRRHSPAFIPELFLHKLVLSSPPSPSSFPLADTSCVALAIIDRRVLTFCRPGDSKWTPLDESGEFGSYDDIIYSVKGRCFYSLSDCGWKRDHQLVSWDLANPSLPRKTVFNPTPVSLPSRKWRSSSPESYQYLVECSGAILMVVGFMEEREEDGTTWAQSQGFFDLDKVQEPNRTVCFDVYKLEHAKKKWKMVESIGDHALFLGHNHSFSLSTRDFPQLRPNSIYFTDHPWDAYFIRKGGPPLNYPNMGIFNMHDKSIEPYFPVNAKAIHPLPIWVAPLH